MANGEINESTVIHYSDAIDEFRLIEPASLQIRSQHAKFVSLACLPYFRLQRAAGDCCVNRIFDKQNRAALFRETQTSIKTAFLVGRFVDGMQHLCLLSSLV